MVEAQKRTAAAKKAAPAAAPKPAYKVLRNVEHPILEGTLNDMAADGWRLHSFVAAHGGYLCVFER